MKRSEMVEYMKNVWCYAISANIKNDLTQHMDTLLLCLEKQGMLPPEIKVKEKGLIFSKIKKINKWEPEL